jgi:endonuclease/exonuclease/phosphatase family metal-dependent hydrolase
VRAAIEEAAMRYWAIGSVVMCCSAAQAQWNPPAGQWGKSDPTDVRVMTWNVQDGVCSTNTKAEARTDWCALARIVAAMQPDVLIMQEAGDNSGEGTGGTEDTVAQLTQAIDLFVHGGADVFHGGVAVGSWVQHYAPGFDLPYVFVSATTDGYNRNVILSRFPFGDLNGDGAATRGDFSMLSDLYAPGTNGGIRGFATAEIVLPPETYAGGLVVGCCHLKSGSTGTDLSDRLAASENIAYYLDYFFNGAGAGVPDPRARFRMTPRPMRILDAATPIIWGGDFNEDIVTEGRRGPAQWMTRAAIDGGTDGTDRDRSDSVYDDARDLFTGSRITEGTQYKDDYICWQDSIAAMRRVWIFNTATVPAGAMPPEIIGYTGGAAVASAFASDHRPVVADFILPPAAIAPGTFGLLSPADGSVNVSLTPTLTWAASAGAVSYTVHITGPGGPVDLPGITSTSVQISPGVLERCAGYVWGVTAVNVSGGTPSSPSSRIFTTVRPADFNGDGIVNVADYLAFLAAYSVGDLRVDFTGDGMIDVGDYLAFLGEYSTGC